MKKYSCWGITQCQYDGKKCLIIRETPTEELLKDLAVIQDADILIVQKSKIMQLERLLIKFQCIQMLVINEMSLNTLPPCICSFNHLSLLDVSNNLLSSLPDEIVQLTSLTVLDLSKNRLRNIDAVCGLSHLQTLDVTENKLEELPRSLWKLEGLQTFSCSLNQLVCLPEEIGCLKYLIILRLNNNRLSSVSRSFSNLTGLLLLQLDGNCFDHIPSQLFSCTSLLELSLAHNKIEGNLPSRISSLVALRTLNLACNKISDFPVELEQLQSLEYLNVSDNPVKNFSLPLGKLNRIQEFSASGCGLAFVPEDLGLCSNLIILDLSENKIERLANESLSFPQLTSLCLAYNIISSLPVSICDLKNLVVLELQFNRLNSLPDEFGEFSCTLRQLDLGHNVFEVIPISVFHIKSRLSYLCLDSNPISEVPDEIGNLKELTHLSVSDCSRLKEGRPLLPAKIPDGWYHKSLALYPEASNYEPEYIGKSYKTIDTSVEDFLSETRTSEGLPCMIGNLVHLVHLSLQHNGLFALPDVFHNMKLQRLNLSFNRLRFLPPNFHKSKHLTHLYLHNNNIDQLDQNFRNLKTLRILTLRNNPLWCPPLDVGSDKAVFPVFFYLKQQNLYEAYILKSLCEIVINNLPKENTHNFLRKIGFSDILIESLEKQFPGGYNHVKRLKIAMSAWSGYPFDSDSLHSNESLAEPYPIQQINSSKNLIQPDKGIHFTNEVPSMFGSYLKLPQSLENETDNLLYRILG
ncbi:unnamed protein product [Trichobilharzia regenti]|nr:unnamed protein product [Trichobilharzia regenti]